MMMMRSTSFKFTTPLTPASGKIIAGVMSTMTPGLRYCFYGLNCRNDRPPASHSMPDFDDFLEIAMHKLIAAALMSLFATQFALAQAPAATDKKAEAKPAATAPAAAETKKDATPQQNRMKTCNQDAKGKKGDERKAFMKECLSGKAPAASAAAETAEKPQQAQQSKMKTCNQEAKGKKGDERKAFMKECLSGDKK